MPSEEVTGCEYLKSLTSPPPTPLIFDDQKAPYPENGLELTTDNLYFPFLIVLWHLTNLIVFDVRLRSASKVAGGAYGPGNRSRRDDLGHHGWY